MVATLDRIIIPRSRIPHHFRADRCTARSLTGLDPTQVRSGTLAVNDAAGSSWTARSTQPAWHWVDDGSGVLVPTLSMGVGEYWSWPLLVLPQALTIYLRVRMLTAATSGTGTYGIMSVGNAADTGARLGLYHLTATSGYTFQHHNGTSPLNASLTGNTAANVWAEFRCVVNANGAVLLGSSINGATETTASSGGSLSFAAAFSDTKIWLNGLGNQQITGAQAYRTCKVALGVRDMTFMRRIF